MKVILFLVRAAISKCYKSDARVNVKGAEFGGLVGALTKYQNNIFATYEDTIKKG